MSPLQHIKSAAKNPYDAPDDWDGETKLDLPDDWAYRAARGIIDELSGRSGFDAPFNDGVDEETRAEIVETMRDIIAAALEQAVKTNT